MVMKQSDPSAISVLDALNSDDYEKSSETSESEGNNVSEATILQFYGIIIITMRSIKRIIMRTMRDFLTKFRIA